MNTSSVLQRLIMLVALPITALLIALTLQFSSTWQSYQASRQTLQLMSLSAAMGELTHNLQVERGLTAGFLQSKGQNFAEMLPKSRLATDQALAAFSSRRLLPDQGQYPSLDQALRTLDQRFGEIEITRRKATELGISVVDEVKYYTGLIQQLSEAMGVGIEYNRDAQIAIQMAAYLNLIQVKENAGLERALMATAFSANQVDRPLLQKIIDKISQQNAYLNAFEMIAPKKDVDAVKAVQQGTPSQEVLKMRGILLDKAGEGDFGVNPEQWFAIISEKIDGMHSTETDIAQGIINTASSRMEASRSAYILLLVAGGATLLASLLISLAIARSISQPLREMVDFAEHAIRQNDFSGTIPEQGVAEVARTGRAFNTLVAGFRGIIQNTRQSSERITQAAHVLSQSSRQLGESSMVQSSAAEAVAAAVEESSVSVSETASNARAASDVVDKARIDNDTAMNVMRDTVRNMNSIAQLISASGVTVRDLENSSQKIGNIVQVIKEIAEQTNLLALNAAIEAARAGEQGRGFAVVADEVRKLAERTTTATGEISALIGQIKGGIEGTVTTMQEANVQASASLELVDRTERALHQIDEGSHAIAANVENISGALAEQDAAIRQIAVKVEEIAQMTESNNVAATANQRTAGELDQLATQLEQAVSIYHV